MSKATTLPDDIEVPIVRAPVPAISSFYSGYRNCDTHFDPDKEPSLTHQSFKDECDVNQILHKLQKTGLVTHINHNAPHYGDYSDPVDFQQALNTVISAHEAFDSLPSAIRDRFANDPSKFLAYAADPKNSTEMIELGLKHPAPAPSAPQNAGAGAGASPPEGGENS